MTMLWDVGKMVCGTELIVSCCVTHPLVYNQTANDIDGKMVIVTEASLWC